MICRFKNMKLTYLIIVLSAVIAQIEGKKILNAKWDGPCLKLPPIKFHKKERMDAVLKTINQTLDHFTEGATDTFEQRYAENLQYFNGTGPMILFLGGESAIENILSYLYTGLAVDLAKQNGAALYMLEHRYYGSSFPSGSFGRLYLKVDQALADITYFVRYKKVENTGINKVILVGGSYTASLAAWARQTYPDVIDAAVAASGIYNIKINNYEFYEVVQKSIENYPGCIDVVKDTFTTIKKKLRTFSGIKQIESDYQVSIPVLQTLVSAIYRRTVIDGLIMTPVLYTVQYDQMAFNISDMCGTLSANNSLSNTQKMGNYYNSMYNNSASDNSTYSTSDAISWRYQVCVEVGNLITTTSKNQPFYNNEPLWFHYFNCAKNVNIFSPALLQFYNPNLSKAYGGTNMNVTKVVFTVGSIDPWNGVGLTKDLNAEAPVITIQGSSHCAVLTPAANSTALTNARNRISSLIKQWIQ